MKIALVKKDNRVRLEKVDISAPGFGEVLLRIDACGVCGSDYLEATAWAQEWKRFGHEIAATVSVIGPGVEGFTVGDQVVLALSVACGKCSACLSGNPRRCSALIMAEQGGFGEYLLVKDTRLLFKVEPPFPADLAAFTEPATVVLDAFHLAGLGPEDKLVVVGGGFIACISLLIAKALGVMDPLVLSRTAHPGLNNCLKATNGQHICWQVIDGETIAAPESFGQNLSGSLGRVVVLHTAPVKFMPLYLERLPYDSIIVNLGLSGADEDNQVRIDAARLIFKRIQLMSAFPVPCLYLAEAVSLIQKNQEVFSLLETEKVGLEQLPEVIMSKRNSKRKVLIFPFKAK